MSAAREISRFAWPRYRGAPLSVRILMTLRPHICPFDVVADAVPVGSRALDVGCGAGLLLHWLADGRRLAAGLGIDTSARAVAVAASCVPPDRPLRFEMWQTGRPWPAGTYDVVTLVDVLHHVPLDEQHEFLKRLIATGARTVIVKDIDPRPRWKAWMNALHDFVMTRRRVHLRAMADVAAWLEESGFRITRVERLDRLWYSHYVVIGERKSSEVHP